jgi:hypothetical protein
LRIEGTRIWLSIRNPQSAIVEAMLPQIFG